MADQLLWFEALLKGTIGLVMLVFPVTAAKVAGLPHGNVSFWPRLFGAALLGLAAAFAVEGSNQIQARGLGLGGALAINFVATLALLGLLTFKGAGTRRGAALLWAMIALLILLMMFEIAYA